MFCEDEHRNYDGVRRESWAKERSRSSGAEVSRAKRRIWRTSIGQQPGNAGKSGERKGREDVH